MNIQQINEQIKLILQELDREEMEKGTKIDAQDFPDAVQKIYDLYKQGKLNVYCPDVFEFKYINNNYALCAVSGKRHSNGQIKYGIAHVLDKHVGDKIKGYSVTEQQLVNAMKRTELVLKECLENNSVIYNKETNRIVCTKDNYYYFITLPYNDKEVCFLTTVFKAEKSYLKKLKRKYSK